MSDSELITEVLLDWFKRGGGVEPAQEESDKEQ